MLQEAQAAQVQTNGYKLDKNHIFMVSMFDDFEKYAKVPEEYAPPENKPYVPRVFPHFPFLPHIGHIITGHWILGCSRTFKQHVVTAGLKPVRTRLCCFAANLC